MPVGSRILEAAALGLVEVDQDQVFERDHHQPSSAAIAVVKISCLPRSWADRAASHP